MSASLANPVGTTLERYILRKQADFPYATGELSQLLRDLALAGKILARDVARAGLDQLGGALGSTPSADAAPLAAIAHVRFLRSLRNGGQAAAVLSGEEAELVLTGNDGGKYVVALAPLAGADTDAPAGSLPNEVTGSIFSIYRRESAPGTRPTAADFRQGGRRQVAAGYLLYGPVTWLAYTTGHGVAGFTYDASLGEFLLSHPRLQVPATGNLVACDEGYWFEFPEYVRRFLMILKQRRFSSRYAGSLVADYHRCLLQGGIGLHPPTSRHHVGALRLLTEALPLAYLFEQAGGAAVAGPGGTALLDVQPATLHQTTPFFAGSADLVAELLVAATADAVSVR